MKNFLALLALFIVVSSPAQNISIELIDSSLLYDYNVVPLCSGVKTVPDTLVYKGERYITVVDLFAYGLTYFHVPDSMYYDCIAERSRRKIEDASRGYRFGSSDAGYIYISPESMDMPPRLCRTAVTLGFKSVKDSYGPDIFYIPLVKLGEGRLNASGNLITSDLYIARLSRNDGRDNIRIKDMQYFKIVVGPYNNQDSLAEYFTRIAGRKLLKSGKSARIQIAIDIAGDVRLIACDDVSLKPFLNKALSSLPIGAFTPNYEISNSEVQLYVARINPLLTYQVSFDRVTKKVVVRNLDTIKLGDG